MISATVHLVRAGEGLIAVGRLCCAVEPEPVEVKPVEKRDYTAQELLEFDGTDLSKAVLVVIKENIFDVTGRRDLYGPEGPYGVFAGAALKRCTESSGLSRRVLPLRLASCPFASSMPRGPCLLGQGQGCVLFLCAFHS